MTLPTSQAVTPTDQKLEELIAMLLETYDDDGWQSESHVAARAALREYVSATTLTEEEANAVMSWCYNSQPTADMSSSSKSRNSALVKLRRRASMKEPPE